MKSVFACWFGLLLWQSWLGFEAIIIYRDYNTLENDFAAQIKHNESPSAVMQNFPLPPLCSILISAIHQLKRNKWFLIYCVQQKSRLIFIEIFNFSIQIRMTNPDSDRQFYQRGLTYNSGCSGARPESRAGMPAEQDVSQPNASQMIPAWAYCVSVQSERGCVLLSAAFAGAAVQYPARLSPLGSGMVQDAAEEKDS